MRTTAAEDQLRGRMAGLISQVRQGLRFNCASDYYYYYATLIDEDDWHWVHQEEEEEGEEGEEVATGIIVQVQLLWAICSGGIIV